MDPETFPSSSQARKSIQHGRLLVVRRADCNGSSGLLNVDGIPMSEATIHEQGAVIADPTTFLHDGDVVAVRSRLPDDYYPESCTKYVGPPPNYADVMSVGEPVLYEDDHIAVVNKAEGIDTIGTKRHDLQSALLFMLRPPAVAPSKQSRSGKCRCYLPRPIHRLDRRTSGCVVIAKSEEAMKRFSKSFSTRQVQKSYRAVTFGEPKSDETDLIEVNGEMYHTINYPIDGKDAVTLWRVVTTVDSPKWGQLSLLHLLPKTGRNHQLRRHLSYCLGCSIVGDTKYDGGGELARESRELGMFLCSNSLEFRHVMLGDESILRVSIPLPDKFHELLVVSSEDIAVDPLATASPHLPSKG